MSSHLHDKDLPHDLQVPFQAHAWLLVPA